jgi:hypothetical protein
LFSAVSAGFAQQIQRLLNAGAKPRDSARSSNVPACGVHPKAMPVILTTPDEIETWMTASPNEALKLQRPLPDGTLRIIARGAKEDPGVAA